MSLVEIHWQPSDRQLRQFSAICLVAPAILAWLATHDPSWAVGIGAIGAALGVLGLWRPPIVRPLFVGLSLITAPIGMVLGECALLIVYLLVVTPIGWLLRALGKDPLDKQPESSCATYWDEHTTVDEPRQYYRQF